MLTFSSISFFRHTSFSRKCSSVLVKMYILFNRVLYTTYEIFQRTIFWFFAFINFLCPLFSIFIFVSLFFFLCFLQVTMLQFFSNYLCHTLSLQSCRLSSFLSNKSYILPSKNSISYLSQFLNYCAFIITQL